MSISARLRGADTEMKLGQRDHVRLESGLVRHPVGAQVPYLNGCVREFLVKRKDVSKEDSASGTLAHSLQPFADKRSCEAG